MADWEDAPSSPPSSSGWEDAPTSKAPDEKKGAKAPDEKKGAKEAVEKGQVYVKPVLGLSAETTGALYSGAETALETLRGIGQMVGIGGEGALSDKQIKTALQKNPEYKRGAVAGEVGGTLTDPVLLALPLGRASTLGQFAKQSAAVGAAMGFTGVKEEGESRGAGAVGGAVTGYVGGAVLGTVVRAGGKLFGKDWLPWKATAKEKMIVVEDILKEHPEMSKEDLNHFLNAPEDKHINAKKHAEDLIEKAASKKEVEKAIEKQPLVNHYLEEYRTRYEAIKESKLGEVKQGEVLPPEVKAEPGVPKIEEKPLGLQEQAPKLPGQSGFASPQLAADIAGTGVGALLDPEDPLTGAVVGLAVAHGGMKALEKVTGKALDKVVAEAAPDVLQGARKAVGMTANEIRVKQHAAFAVSNKVSELVKDEARRETVAHALETPSLVSALSKEEREAHNLLRRSFDSLGERAKEAGVVKELRENYITHIVDLGKDKSKSQEALDFFLGKGISASGLGKTSTKFGKERAYETIKDLEAAGFKLKTKDAAQLYKMYADSVERAIAGKSLVNHLSSKILPGGKSAMVKLGAKQSVPFGWVVNSSLPGHAIHPDMAPLLEHIFSSNSPGAVMRGATAITNAVKRNNVMASLFHFYNLGWSTLLSAPGKGIKEIITAGSGIRSARHAFEKGGLESSNAIKNGLILEIPIDVEKGVLGHLGAMADSAAEKGGFSLGAEKGGKVLEKYTLGITDKLTWDYMHTGGKLMVYQHLLDSMKFKNPNLPEDELGKEAAKFVNNVFGGLNWTQIAADSNKKIVAELTNPRSRAVMALAEFAPDWSLSTVRAALDAVPRSIGANETLAGVKGMWNPKTSSDLSRQYMMRTALTYFTLFNGMNLALSGKPIWENKDPTRVEFADGTSMQVAKHAFEPVEWALHPEKTLANKMAFLPRAALMYWGEKQYPFGPELEDKTPTGKMQEIGKMALPFSVAGAMAAPEGKGIEKAILGTVGIPTYGKTQEEKLKERQARGLRIQQQKRELKQKMRPL